MSSMTNHSYMLPIGQVCKRKNSKCSNRPRRPLGPEQQGRQLGMGKRMDRVKMPTPPERTGRIRRNKTRQCVSEIQKTNELMNGVAQEIVYPRQQQWKGSPRENNKPTEQTKTVTAVAGQVTEPLSATQGAPKQEPTSPHCHRRSLPPQRGSDSVMTKRNQRLYENNRWWQ